MLNFFNRLVTLRLREVNQGSILFSLFLLFLASPLVYKYVWFGLNFFWYLWSIFFLVVTYVNIFTQCLYTSFPYFGVFWFSVLFYFQSIASAFIFYVRDNQIRFCFPFSSPVFFCYNISTILVELYNKDTLFSLLPTYFNLRSSIVH